MAVGAHLSAWAAIALDAARRAARDRQLRDEQDAEASAATRRYARTSC